MSFYIKGKNLFITVSQVEENLKEKIQFSLIKHERYLDGGLIAEEFHVDKGVHYHIILKYKKYKKIVSNCYFNYLLGKQVNIHKIKNLNAVELYCKKLENYIVFGNFDDKSLNDKKNQKVKGHVFWA